jgi:hypothetical protein
MVFFCKSAQSLPCPCTLHCSAHIVKKNVAAASTDEYQLPEKTVRQGMLVHFYDQSYPPATRDGPTR